MGISLEVRAQNLICYQIPKYDKSLTYLMVNVRITTLKTSNNKNTNNTVLISTIDGWNEIQTLFIAASDWSQQQLPSFHSPNWSRLTTRKLTKITKLK